MPTQPRDPKPEPESEPDWTIRALSIHGAFLEAWCRDLVGRVPGWSLRYYNYPVEWKGVESAVDVRADMQVGLQQLSFLIECKKNNPDLTEWVFFRKRRVLTASPTPVFHAALTVNANGAVCVGEQSFRGFPWMSVVAEDGRETRGNYLAYKNERDKTKTSNHDIAAAARQVCIAYRAITHEEVQAATGSISQALIPYHPRWLIFVPMIVTTARLHVCEFEPADVDPRSGELPLEKAWFSEVTHLRYEYPMPRSLQWEIEPKPGEDYPDWSEPATRQWVGIVNAAYFERFLQHYADHWNEGIHMTPFPDQPSELLPEPAPEAAPS